MTIEEYKVQLQELEITLQENKSRFRLLAEILGIPKLAELQPDALLYAVADLKAESMGVPELAGDPGGLAIHVNRMRPLIDEFNGRHPKTVTRRVVKQVARIRRVESNLSKRSAAT